MGIRSDPFWAVEHACPQCGAPSFIEDSDLHLECPYCRVRLWIASRDSLVYRVIATEMPERNVVHLPYWRFKAFGFACGSDGAVRCKTIDASLPALSLEGIPPSLGVRPQALRLSCVTPDTPGVFPLPDLPRSGFFPRMESAFSLAKDQFLETPAPLRAYLGDFLAIVYFPFVLEKNALQDGLTGKSVCRMGPEKTAVLNACKPNSGSRARFVSTLCPQCGANLKGGRDSRVLSCGNCGTLWIGSRKGFVNLPFSFYEGEGEHWLPFWKIRTGGSKVRLDTLADLILLANLPKVIRDQDRRETAYLWLPAFKIDPKLFLRISKLLTVMQPHDGEGPLPKGKVHPAAISPDDAAEALHPAVVNLAMNSRMLVPMLAASPMKAVDTRLVLIPFRSRGTEIVQESFRISINKNALRFGMNL
ncbi:MAG: hypothetical protein PHG91_03855 [Syntrophales bacterium]|nr:hypothetical protein [Syntrophales bacterium]